MPAAAALLAAPFLTQAQEQAGPGAGQVLQNQALQDTESVITYRITARSGIRNRKVTGAVVTRVGEVPASPVDSLCLDGDGVVPVQGSAEVQVDPIGNKGWARARWTDEHGTWEFLIERFLHPHHASGLRIGPDAFQVERVILDPAVTNVSMHGNSTAGLPGAPTVFTYLGLWGPATVTLNGQPFANELDSPFMPQWEGHMMLTSGVRGNDGSIRAFDGSIYDPAVHSAMGLQDHDDIELHVVISDGRFPEDPANKPGLYQFFYDIVFEEVVVTIDHKHVEGDQ